MKRAPSSGDVARDAPVSVPIESAAQPLDKRFHKLMALSRALMIAHDETQTLSAILRAGTELVKAQSCSLGLIDDETQQLCFDSMEGNARTAPFRVPLGTGVAGDVAQRGEPALVNDVRDDPRFYNRIDKRTGFETRSLLCIPLWRGERIIGVMQALNSHRRGGFVAIDAETLDELGQLTLAALDRAHDDERLRRSMADLRREEGERYRMWLSRNERMRALMRTAQRAARSDATVLLLGESGSGKEVMARTIHRDSARARGPFVAVNCTALNASLLESELFGHEKGAFTGAIKTKLGKFELADGGTLFLDEIGDMAPDLQTKLLRVLQERELERVGGTETRRVDVRVIAATNRDLQAAMGSGAFREDLFYRLNVISLSLPPLRERPEDIVGLSQRYLERAAHVAKRPVPELTEAARQALRDYRWPGNIRELANLMERIAILSDGPVVDAADLSLPRDAIPLHALPTEPPSEPPFALPTERPFALPSERPFALPTERPFELSPSQPMAEQVRAFKRRLVQDALRRCQGSQTRAAKLLGLQQSNLSRLMKQLGLR